MTKESKNPLFKTMLELSNSSSEEEFLFFVNQHSELLMEDPIQFIGLHVSYYANQDNISEALSVVQHYKDAPYISMEVEDFLNELKEEIQKITQNVTHDFTKEEIQHMLSSGKENSLISALSILAKKNIRDYLPLVQDFLSDTSILYKYKTLLLFILVEQHVSGNFIFDKDGLEYQFDPSQNQLPFQGEAYSQTKNIIEKSGFDPEIISLAIEILNTVQIKNYPDSDLQIYSTNLMAHIFLNIAQEYLQKEISWNQESKNLSLNEAKMNAIVTEIKKIMNQ